MANPSSMAGIFSSVVFIGANPISKNGVVPGIEDDGFQGCRTVLLYRFAAQVTVISLMGYSVSLLLGISVRPALARKISRHLLQCLKPERPLLSGLDFMHTTVSGFTNFSCVFGVASSSQCSGRYS